MYLSSDALSSNTPSFTASPSISRASASTQVVLPIPGEPCTMSRTQSWGEAQRRKHEHAALPVTYRQDHVRHIAVLSNAFQPQNSIFVSYHIWQNMRPVFLYPRQGPAENGVQKCETENRFLWRIFWKMSAKFFAKISWFCWFRGWFRQQGSHMVPVEAIVWQCCCSRALLDSDSVYYIF